MLNDEQLGVRRHAVGGAARMGSGQLARVVIQAASLVVLARLLAPSDYGLIAMVTAIIGIAEILRDFGLTFASIQAREMPRELRDNLFWINAAAGLVLSGIAFAVSHPIAALYGEPRLVGITQVLCWVFLVNGLSAQARADLNRRLRFGALALGDTLAALLGVAAAVALAVLGAGYWALVGQQLVVAGIGTAFYLAAAGWWPRWYRRGVSVAGPVRYGVSLLANQTLTYATLNADSVIIGARIGVVPLGVYDRAFQLLALPLSKLTVPATKVALPILSRAQDDAPRFRRLLLTGQAVIVHPVMLLFSVMLGFGQLLIPLVLGRQWTGAVEPFQILCLGGCAIAANYSSYWAFLATGSMRRYLKLSLVTAPLIVLCMLAGSSGGIDGVAAGYSIGYALAWPMSVWALRGHPNVPAGALLARSARALLWHALPGVAAALVVRQLGTGLVGCGWAAVAYLVLGATGLLSGGLRAELAAVAGLLRRRSRPTVSQPR